MTNVPADLLGRPAAQSVRIIALGYLEDATLAFERTGNADDALALHDFRVALRRLRTTLRAYRPLFEDSVRGKPHKLLGEIAEGTNRVREAEVALEWLRPLATGMTPGERVGLQWLVDRVDARRAKDLEQCLADTRRSFTAAARKLHKGLVAYRQTVQTEPSINDESFAGALRTAAVEQARQQVRRHMVSIAKQAVSDREVFGAEFDPGREQIAKLELAAASAGRDLILHEKALKAYDARALRQGIVVAAILTLLLVVAPIVWRAVRVVEPPLPASSVQQR